MTLCQSSAIPVPAIEVGAEFFGLEVAFYIVGICGVALTGLLTVWLSRQPELKRSGSAV